MGEKLSTISQDYIASQQDIEIDDDDESEVVIDLSEKRTRVESHSVEEDPLVNQNRKKNHKYKLLEYCVTRWYSCWLVMLRFYCLYDAIEELLRQIEMGNVSVKSTIKEKLKQSKNGLSKEVIHDVLHLLFPLVQGIDYCQRDSSVSMTVGPLMDEILQFLLEYSNERNGTCLVRIPEMTLHDIFKRRRALFGRCITPLQNLFLDDYYRQNPDNQSNETLQLYSRTIVDGIEAFAMEENSSVTRELKEAILSSIPDLLDEVQRFIRDKKYRSDIHSFMTNSSTLYPILSRMYRELFVQPSSSASVERSFSIQNAFHLPQRNRMDPNLVKMMLFNRINHNAIVKCGWENELRMWLSKDNKKRDVKDAKAPQKGKK